MGAKAIRDALGVGDYDKVRVITPQFDRDDGKTVTYIPKTVEEFDGLKKAPDDILADIGLGKWDRDAHSIHWLFPAEWYDHIPEGYPILSIMGDEAKFEKGKTDNDKRCGCLSFGFRKLVDPD